MASECRDGSRLRCGALHAVRHLVVDCALLLDSSRCGGDVFADGMNRLFARCQGAGAVFRYGVEAANLRTDLVGSTFRLVARPLSSEATTAPHQPPLRALTRSSDYATFGPS